MYTTRAVLSLLLFQTCVFGLGVERLGQYSKLNNRVTYDETFSCPSPDGVFPSEQGCSQDYYLCVGGVAYPQTCPGNTVFNEQTQLCDYPSLVPCQPGPTKPTDPTSTTEAVTESTSTSTTTSSTTTEITSTTTEQTTTTGSSVFTCPTPDGFFPIPDTCGNSYYVCISNYPYLTDCPGNSVFDPMTSVCVPPESASCNTEFACPEENGFFPLYPGACSNSFYSCISNNAYLQYCPNDSIFDPTISVCVPKGTESCSSRSMYLH